MRPLFVSIGKNKFNKDTINRTTLIVTDCQDCPYTTLRTLDSVFSTNLVVLQKYYLYPINNQKNEINAVNYKIDLV